MFGNRLVNWMTVLVVSGTLASTALATAPLTPATELDAMVVSATRSENDLLKLAASASKMDAERIKDEEADSVADLLSCIPGVDVTSSKGHMLQPALRGLPESQTIIKVDGARENYVQPGGDAQSTILVDPDLLKAVEVVRGPSSALHGSGGIGGVISMTTKDAADFLKPGAKAGATVKAGASSANHSVSGTAIAYGRSETFDIVASTTYRDYGDYKSSSTKSDEKRTERSGNRRQHMIKGSWNPDETKRVSLTATRYEHEFTYPKKDEKDSWYEGEQNRFVGNVEITPGSQWVDARMILMHSERNEDQFNFKRNKLEFISSGTDLQNTMRFTTGPAKHRMVLGGDLYRDEYKPSTADGVDDFTNPPGEGMDTGLFVQDEIALLDGKVLITPALRYTAFKRSSNKEGSQAKDGSDSRMNPKLSVSWNPIKSFGMYASYAEAFRAPLVSDMYVELDMQMGPNRFVILANPDLKPETAKTREMGFHISRDGLISARDNFRFKASYFMEDIEDLISSKILKDLGPDSSERIVKAINVNSVERKGYELEANYALGGFGGTLTYAKVDSRSPEEKDTYAGETPASFMGRVHYRFADTGIKLGWKSKFVKSFSTGDKSYDSYDVHGIFARWELVSGTLEGFSAGLFVDNLFDEEYDAYHFKESGPGMARNVKVAVGYAF